MTMLPVLTATVEHKSDGVNLHNYPGLTYAPLQHGDFIAFAHNGKRVDDVAGSEEASGAKHYIDDLAAHLGVSFGDICDALKFLRDQKAI